MAPRKTTQANKQTKAKAPAKTTQAKKKAPVKKKDAKGKTTQAVTQAPLRHKVTLVAPDGDERSEDLRAFHSREAARRFVERSDDYEILGEFVVVENNRVYIATPPAKVIKMSAVCVYA
jgi:hypothetical protein